QRMGQQEGRREARDDDAEVGSVVCPRADCWCAGHLYLVCLSQPVGRFHKKVSPTAAKKELTLTPVRRVRRYSTLSIARPTPRGRLSSLAPRSTGRAKFDTRKLRLSLQSGPSLAAGTMAVTPPRSAIS